MVISIVEFSNGCRGEKVQNFGGANDFYGAVFYFDLEKFGVLNTNNLPISRNIGGVIAPPAPPIPAPLQRL